MSKGRKAYRLDQQDEGDRFERGSEHGSPKCLYQVACFGVRESRQGKGGSVRSAAMNDPEEQYLSC
jgi:hypothetical protein